jgi:tetratricopeptide (TPR) repeat protein
MGGAADRLSRHEESRRHYEIAVAIDRELLRASPEDPAARLDLSFDLAALAKIDDEHAGRPEAAMAALREALALRQSVLDQDPLNVQARAGVARAHRDLAWMLSRRGAWDDAEAEMRRGVAEREKVVDQAKGSSGPPFELAKALAYLGDVLVAPGRPASPAREAEACALFRRSESLFLGVRERLPRKDQGWLEVQALGARCRDRASGGGR